MRLLARISLAIAATLVAWLAILAPPAMSGPIQAAYGSPDPERVRVDVSISRTISQRRLSGALLQLERSVVSRDGRSVARWHTTAYVDDLPRRFYFVTTTPAGFHRMRLSLRDRRDRLIARTPVVRVLVRGPTPLADPTVPRPPPVPTPSASPSPIAIGDAPTPPPSAPAIPTVSPSPTPTPLPPDREAPDTRFTTKPATPTASPSAVFAFEGTPANDVAGFLCSLDSLPVEPCDAGAYFAAGNPDGDHHLSVAAYDAAGNVDPTPATFTWSVDTTAPRTAFVRTPAARSNAIAALVTYSADDASATFECQVGDAGFAPCPADGLQLDDLAHGAHRIRVRARDALGNVEPDPAEHRFIVDLRAPDTVILDDAPPEVSRQPSVVVPYRGTPESDVDRIECSLDGGPFEACDLRSMSITTPTDREHELEVRAVDQVGNVDPTPARHTWRTDRTAPDTAIESGPPARTPGREANVTFSSPSDDALRFECAVDGGGYRPCALTGIRLRSLLDGDHSVEVRAVDEVGNVDATPARHSWVVDGPAPMDAPVVASEIAEAFPSALRDALPHDGVDPGVGNLQAGRGFPLTGGINGQIGATLADGASTSDGGVSLGVTPAGRSNVTGLVRDNAVVYDAPDDKDVLMRGTGSGGTEVISQLSDGQHSTAYTVDLPAGAELRELDNGAVAVVQPGVAPAPEIAALAERVETAEDEIVAATIETASDATEAARGFEQAAASARAIVETTAPAVGQPQEVDALRDPAGEISAIADPAATNAQVADAVSELEQGIRAEDIPEAYAQKIDAAEQQLADATGLLADVEEAERRAIEAEASRMLDDQIDAVLHDAAIEHRKELANAHLDIGDTEAEQLRTALDAVDAQRRVDDGRVVGLVTAPMVKDADGEPLVAALNVSGARTVTLEIPRGVEGGAVADPWFVPVALVVVRVVVAVAPRAMPVLRAAAQGAKQVLSKGGSAATKVGQTATKVVKTGTNAAKGAARSAVNNAGRAVSQARGAAASAARAAQASGQAAARLRAQAEESARIAAQRIRQAQEEGKRVLDDMVRKAADEWRAVARQRDEIAREVAEQSRKVIQDVAAKSRAAGQSVRQTVEAMGAKLNVLIRNAGQRARDQLPFDTAWEAGSGAIQTWVGKATQDWNTALESCSINAAMWLLDRRVGGKPVGAAAVVERSYTVHDVIDCMMEFYSEMLDREAGTGGGTALPPGAVQPPTREELRAAFEQADADADREGAATLAQFPPPPPTAQERRVSVLSEIVPGSIAASRLGYLQITAINDGRPLPLASTHLYVPGGFPWIRSGNVPGDGARIVLTDENADGIWSYREMVTAVIEVNPPLMRDRTVGVPYSFISEGQEFSGGRQFVLNITGPRERITLFNKVTNGPTQIREDAYPVRLLSQPWTYCTSRGCNIYGTERWTDGTYDHAVCVTTGERYTNGEDYNSRDDGNPYLASSTWYYGVQLGGTFGYVNFVWVHPTQRDGRGLPGC